jgi:hypothetical protein
MNNYDDNKHYELLYVNCYAKKYIMCNSISKLKNGMCDECYKDINRNLTEKELFDNYVSIKDIIVIKIKILLNLCDKAIGEKNKTKEMYNIFDIIYHNIYFTFSSIKFIKTYINKVIHFVKYDIKVINEFADEQINNNDNNNIIYIDILDFIININYHYKDIKIDDPNLKDSHFLTQYNNIMKEIYNSICKKYNNEQSLNKSKDQFYHNTFYNNLDSILIDV